MTHMAQIAPAADMALDPPDLPARLQRWRGVLEPAFWILFLCSQAAVNSWIAWVDSGGPAGLRPFWEPATWEWSSHLVILALLPALLAFERRVPLRLVLLRRNLPWHLLATVVFSLVHVGAMVAIRKLVYLSQHQIYDFGFGWRVLAYEYLKDARTYFVLLIFIGFYRLLMLRWQGEATLLEAPDAGAPVEPVERPERFLVQKLGKEFLLPAAEIEWLQAWGNYVNLRVRGHDYPLRATMVSIEQRLDPRRFTRVHRSYIVNLDFVVEIEPLESGDARAKLRDGTAIPVSRRYRGELRRASTAG
jgi:hypothetical protein